MNKKDAMIVGVLLLSTFVGTVFADTVTTSRTIITTQTTSVDIEVAKAQGYSSIYSSAPGILVANYGSSNPKINLTATFSFAPIKGILQVNSVSITIIYSPSSNLGQGSSFLVELNGHQAVALSIVDIQQSTIVGGLNGPDLHVGSNQIRIGISPGTSVVGIYETRLTVEYTFTG